MNFSSNAITSRLKLGSSCCSSFLQFCNLIARIVNYLTNYSFILITLRFLSPSKQEHSTLLHVLKKAKICLNAAVAFVCLIIKLTVICFCWCCDGKKTAEEKGACLSLSEIVYSSILSQPRHLAALLLLPCTARDGERGKVSFVSHNECNRETRRAKNVVEQKLIYLTRGGHDGT